MNARTIRISVQTEDFDVGQELNRMRLANPKVGALVSFVGVVRDFNDGDQVSTLTLEHYPGMTEKALNEIVACAGARWQIMDVVVIHRVGELKPLEQIVLVIVSSAHRGEAFEACHFIMDYLKTEAPFWKKESTPNGANWLDARESDTQAKARWEN